MRTRISLIAALTILLSSFNALGRTDDADGARKSPALPFEAGEQLVYEGEFSKLILRGIKIAEFHFAASRQPTDATEQAQGKASPSPRLSLVGDVRSEGWFHRLFNIDFHFRLESLVEGDTFSVLKTTKLDEQGKRVRTSETLFDRQAKTISWTELNPKDPLWQPRVVNAPFEGHVHDILSAIYYLRTQALVPGKSFELTLSDSGQVFRVPGVVVAERKLMKTAVGRVPVVRLDVELFGEGRPLEGEGKMSIWMTTDARRLPVRARLSSDIGMLDIKLKKYSPGPSEAKAR